jgi:hypothetical protein
MNQGIRGNPGGRQTSNSNISQVVEVDPLLEDLCIQLNRMNESIDKTNFLSLAKDLIKGTPRDQKVVAFKKKIWGHTAMNEYDDDRANLGITSCLDMKIKYTILK